jgi:hypothetical protein
MELAKKLVHDAAVFLEAHLLTGERIELRLPDQWLQGTLLQIEVLLPADLAWSGVIAALSGIKGHPARSII